MVILPLGRDEPAVHPFLLQAQHHHHIGTLQPPAHVIVQLAAKVLHARGHQRRGGDQAQPVLHLAQEDQVRPRHPGMRDVAADRDRQALDAALRPADGQRVKQRLCRMLMPPVARVQHGAIHLLRQQVHRPRRPVPHHQEIGVHRVQRHRGVDQGLALFHRRIADGHVHHIRPQPLAREFKAGLRAGGGFEEQVDLRHARQDVGLLDRAAVQVDIAFRQVKDRDDLQRAKLLDPQKVAGAEGHRRFPCGFPPLWQTGGRGQALHAGPGRGGRLV